MAKPKRRKAQQERNTARLIWGIVALIILGAAAIWFTTQNAATSSYPTVSGP